MKMLREAQNDRSQANEIAGNGVVLLNQTLANLSDLYSQSKQAQWNVRGYHLYALRKLFKGVAASIGLHIDPLAERIVALGGVANGTVRQTASKSTLSEFPTDNTEGMTQVIALAERFAQFGASVRKSIDDLTTAGDLNTTSLLTKLYRDVEKGLWSFDDFLYEILQ